MKNIFMLFLVIFVSAFQIEVQAQKKNYISIVVPEEMNIETPLSKYRLAANTLAGSEVTINGKKIKVYNSGAFVDLMKLKFGENKFTLKSKYKNGKTIKKSFSIFRKDKKLKTSTKSKLVIDDEMMLPSQNTWLDSGDILNVRV
ncbi:MAG: hypothetical protein V3V16_01450, partial [Melioribacteraceae bacterium]